jgi:hypothetical protein
VSLHNLNNSFEGLSLDRRHSAAMATEMSTEQKADIFAQLMHTVKECSDRGLYQSAKWYPSFWAIGS